MEPSRTLHTNPKYKTQQLMIRTIESQTQCLMHIPGLFYRYCNCQQRGRKLIAWWLDYSHDISCSNLSNTESMASTIPRTGLKRMGLTLLLIIIYVFWGIKIIIACSAHTCKRATTIVSKKMLQTHIDIFHSEKVVSYVSNTEVTKDRPLPLIQ